MKKNTYTCIAESLSLYLKLTQHCKLTSFVTVVRLLSLCPTLLTPMDCSTPGLPSFTISHHLLKFMSTESVMLDKQIYLTLSHLIHTRALEAGLQWVTLKILEIFLERESPQSNWKKTSQCSHSTSRKQQFALLMPCLPGKEYMTVLLGKE